MSLTWGHWTGTRCSAGNVSIEMWITRPLLARSLTNSSHSLRLMFGPLVVFIIVQFSFKYLFLFRYDINLALQLFNLIFYQVFAHLGNFGFSLLLIDFILDLSHILFEVLLKRFVVNQNSILQTWKLIDEWKQVFIHQFFSVIQLNDVI